MDPLYPHQNKAVAEAVRYPKRALWWSPRLGKTRAAAIMVRGKRPVIVAPLSVCGDWVIELQKHGFDPTPLYTMSAHQAGKIIAKGDPTCLVVNIDKVSALETHIKIWKPNALIIDEAHQIKSHNAKRSKAVRKIAEGIPFIRALTGTPVANNYADLWSQMVILDPAWGTWTGFRMRYLVSHPLYPNKYIGVNHVDELEAMISASVDRVLRPNVFGADQWQTVEKWVDMPSNAREAYGSLVQDWLYSHKDGVVLADHALKRLVRLQQLTSGYLRTEDDLNIDMHTAKLDRVLGDLDEIIESGEKAVVFYRFRWEGEKYERAIRSQYLGVPVASINGDVSADDRTRTLQMFNALNGPMVIVAQIQAAGVGISMRAATHALFVSQSFSFTEHTQARDRIYVPGQNRCVTFYRVRGTVDEFIKKVIDAKGDVHEAVMTATIQEMALGEKGAQKHGTPVHPLPAA